MVDMTKTTTEKKLTPSDIRGVFLRSNLFQGSWNFERMQALGFCFSMVPAIRRLYPETTTHVSRLLSVTWNSLIPIRT